MQKVARVFEVFKETMYWGAAVVTVSAVITLQNTSNEMEDMMKLVPGQPKVTISVDKRTGGEIGVLMDIPTGITEDEIRKRGQDLKKIHDLISDAMKEDSDGR